MASYDPTDIGDMNRHAPPMFVAGGSSAHVLGTDHLGRDVFSRLVYGARISLIIGVTATTMGAFLGTTLGLIAGYFGGWVGNLIMRVVDAMLAFPVLLLALVLAVTIGPSFATVILVLGILSWSGYARLVRGQVLTLRNKEFVLLAQIAGCSPWRIIVQHILPNVVSSIIVLATLQIPGVILAEASLSFLGAGIPPPNPSWGSMIAQGRTYVTTAWWTTLFPGVAIAGLVLSLNLLGDWLRDLWDPRIQGAHR
ncbi:MAG: ABC transporter permease [Chloroflexi bacterium]|nr:ABC transporter permease [Chloroflexota bacterium]